MYSPGVIHNVPDTRTPVPAFPVLPGWRATHLRANVRLQLDVIKFDGYVGPGFSADLARHSIYGMTRRETFCWR